MFKVVCINDKWFNSKRKFNGPKKDEICIVEGSEVENGTLFYFLKGYDEIIDDGYRISFKHSCFAVSDDFAQSITSAIEEEMAEIVKITEEQLINK